MRLRILGLFILVLAQQQVYGLSRVLFCQQREMAPNESSVEVSGADPLSRDLKLFINNVGTTSFKVKDIDVSRDPQKKALYQSSEMSLLITRQVDRSYSGDVGYLAELSGRNFPERSMICWFSKQARAK